MKIIETKTEQNLGGGGLVSIPFVRVIEVPDGTKLSEGQAKAPADAELHDWKPEEAK